MKYLGIVVPLGCDEFTISTTAGYVKSGWKKFFPDLNFGLRMGSLAGSTLRPDRMSFLVRSWQPAELELQLRTNFGLINYLEESGFSGQSLERDSVDVPTGSGSNISDATLIPGEGVRG
jgi:hypothetical protein